MTLKSFEHYPTQTDCVRLEAALDASSILVKAREEAERIAQDPTVTGYHSAHEALKAALCEE